MWVCWKWCSAINTKLFVTSHILLIFSGLTVGPIVWNNLMCCSLTYCTLWIIYTDIHDGKTVFVQHGGLHKYSCGSESSAGVNWPRWNDTNLSWPWTGLSTCERERSGRSIGLSVTICKHETNTKTNTTLYLGPGLAKHLDVCRVLF